MGFSANDDPGNVGKALEMFPLAYALCAADMEAAYFCEDRRKSKGEPYGTNAGKF